MTLTRDALARNRKPNCRFAEILAGLTPEEEELVRSVMAEKSRAGHYVYSSQEVAIWLSKEGHQVGQTTIGKHRREECPTCR